MAWDAMTPCESCVFRHPCRARSFLAARSPGRESTSDGVDMPTAAGFAPRSTARAAGVLFLLTFVTSIPALALFQPVLDDPAGYISGAGHDKQIFLGVTLELLLIVANIGTAVVLFPVLR